MNRLEQSNRQVMAAPVNSAPQNHRFLRINNPQARHRAGAERDNKFTRCHHTKGRAAARDPEIRRLNPTSFITWLRTSSGSGSGYLVRAPIAKNYDPRLSTLFSIVR